MNEKSKVIDMASIIKTAYAVCAAVGAGALACEFGIKKGYEIGTSKLYEVMKGWNSEYAEEFYEYIKNSAKVTFK